MCGLFGYFGPPARMPSPRDAAMALDLIAHRGPDARGMFRNEERGLVLGHVRLSVIDPAARSDQPLTIDETVLAFNGEIYNFRTLREELRAEGAEFRTDGDTEVIAVGYRHWGVAVFKRLLGMFAIALYDGRRQCLRLARDDFGIKPLCLLHRGDELLFASEIKAIAALRSLSIDGGVLTDMLGWGFQMDNASLYSGIRHLPPGHVLTLQRDDRGALHEDERENSPARYAYRDPGPEPTATELRAVVEASVRDHMIADVPVAIALSGGLDSSIIAAAAARHHAGLRAYTFTLSSGTDPEVEHAALLCRHLGLEHRVARMVNGTMDGWLRRVAWHLEEPVTNVNGLLGYGLAALVRSEGFKVVLVGEGADEVFGGYPWYRFAMESGAAGAPETVFDAYRKRRAQSGSARFLRPSALALAQHRIARQRDSFVQRLGEFAHSPLDGFLSFDQETQLQYSQLLRVDRTFMAHGVEARVPFLYRPVLRTSAALPAARKMRTAGGGGRAEKIALAEAFADMLPGRITGRPKFGEQGSVNIWDTWLADGLSREFSRCIESDELRGARQLLDEFIDWQAVTSAALATKEKFAIGLLLEAVDGLLLSRRVGDSTLPVQWESC